MDGAVAVAALLVNVGAEVKQQGDAGLVAAAGGDEQRGVEVCVGPGEAAAQVLGEVVDRLLAVFAGGQVQGGVAGKVDGDLVAVVAGGNQKDADGVAAVVGGVVQRGPAVVVRIRVLEQVRPALENVLDNGELVVDNGPAQALGGFIKHGASSGEDSAEP